MRGKLDAMKTENYAHSKKSKRNESEKENLAEELKRMKEIDRLLKEKSQSCESLNAEVRHCCHGIASIIGRESNSR